MSRTLIDGTCPECRGPLTEISEGEIVEYQCLVGHRYAPDTLLHAHAETEERTLWSAVVALEEARNLAHSAASHLPEPIRRSVELEGERKGQQAKAIRAIIEQLTPFETK